MIFPVAQEKLECFRVSLDVWPLPDFVFDSNRWVLKVLPALYLFSPRYVVSPPPPLSSHETLCTLTCICVYTQMTNLAFVDASEEDKLKVLVNQSLYDPMRSVLHLFNISSLHPILKSLIYLFFFM